MLAHPQACLSLHPLLNVQLRSNLIKWLVFHFCLWRKAYFMKKGIRHNKVGQLADPQFFAAARLQHAAVLGDCGSQHVLVS